MIPNNIHFIYYSYPKVEFTHFLAVASVFKKQQPNNIYIYNDYEPELDFLWECMKKYATIIKNEPPSSYNGVPLTSWQYKADIRRMELLNDQGGVYMDMDIMTLKSFKHLLENHCVVGIENAESQTETDPQKVYSVSNAILMSEPHNQFISDWYTEIGDNLQNKEWAHHAVVLPKLMLEKNKYNVHIEPRQSFMYFSFRDPFIFDGKSTERKPELDNSYVIHLWETIWKRDYLSKIDINWFKNQKNIFTELFQEYIADLWDNKQMLINIILESCIKSHWEKTFLNLDYYEQLCSYYDQKPDIFVICKIYLEMKNKQEVNRSNIVYKKMLKLYSKDDIREAILSCSS